MEAKQVSNQIWEKLVQMGRSTRTTLRIMRSNRVGFIGFLLLVLIVLISFVGPLFIELDTNTKIEHIYETPSSEFWLGTDHQGRDIFSQIVNGGKDVIIVGVTAGFLSTIIGVTFGTLAGFVGGWVDNVIVAFTDFVLTIPRFPLLVVLAATLTFSSNFFLGVILGLLNWPALLRAIRAQALSLKERDFIEAARALDLGTTHIIFREIVPNMMSYIIISFTLAMTGAIYALVGLVLLGLAPFSGTNWGIMLSLAWTRGAIFFKDSIWYIMSPVVAIAVLQLSLITMNRSLELVFNPRLRTEA
ncbi:Dipeptide transport system permease protein DppC (TC 3.A.1.5.2) [hydrothermal vent metagenome]|uniref:Dipeptide transport system permease protein DppC (TC 3.A.1.5.2) n=1 Tax=hydrothermal vent metagenome TaxID=652676 RepID=A0A3B0UZ02_9ZZZZ